MTLSASSLAAGLALALSGGAAPSAFPVPVPVPPPVWGTDGHQMAGRAAATHLPAAMPEFFRRAAPRLGWLNYEPDRWRDRELPSMAEGFRYDHYIDLENVPEGALDARDRWTYLTRVFATDLESPVQDTGLLPYRILELYERVVSGFARWREAAGTPERRWIEERILNDAGVLGHYATDATQPHHATIHFNGWAEGIANPEGYTTADDIHWRFESAFVSAHVTPYEVQSRVRRVPMVFEDLHQAVLAQIRETHGEVETLYRLERDLGFDPDRPAAPRAAAFAADRLAVGATFLRDLWWTAWVRSAELLEEEAGS